MNDFEKLGHFFAERFVIEYFDEDSIYLAIKDEDGFNDGFKHPYSFTRLSHDDFVFLKKFIEVIDYEEFEDERK